MCGQADKQHDKKQKTVIDLSVPATYFKQIAVENFAQREPGMTLELKHLPAHLLPEFLFRDGKLKRPERASKRKAPVADQHRPLPNKRAARH